MCCVFLHVCCTCIHVILEKKTFHCKQPSLRVISAVSFVACCRNVESEALFSDIDGMLLGLTAELDEMLKLQA